MPRILMKISMFVLFLFIVAAATAEMDKSRYIALEEIEPGMTGYALSVYTGTFIEKFPVKVVSVIKNYRPGKDAIFVMGTDERFKHTGPVQGCSGSPVILDGRIAGALAFGWGFVKDPLYGVTPIREMLAISDREHRLESSAGRLVIDYNKLDFAAICGNVSDILQNKPTSGPMGLSPLEVPLVSSLSQDVSSRIESLCGIRLLSGTSGGDVVNPAAGSFIPNFEPGSVISIPMVDGDIKMAAIGTITDVVGDKVYAFGHSFDASGKTELPMAAGLIHMVVANQITSFKFGQSRQVVGAITTDAATGIYGKIGQTAPMIPLNIVVKRSDNPDIAVYNCQLAVHDMYTPYLLQGAIAGAILMQGNLPQEHTIKYGCNIAVKDSENIIYERISSGQNIGPAVFETAGPVAVLMNNQFKKAEVISVDFFIEVTEGDSNAAITYVKTDKNRLKAGQKVNIEIVTEKLYSQKKAFTTSLEIPADTAPGNYQIIISGSGAYRNFIAGMKPYQTMVDDFESMVEVIRKELASETTGLYIFMRTTDNGISIGNSPLEGLPASKMQILSSPKRNHKIMPISGWIEQRLETADIISGQHQINITVAK